MNRKLQHSLTALSATATVFTVLLLAGGPPAPVAPAQPTAMLALSSGVADDGDATPAEAAAGEADADADRGDRIERSHLRRTRAALALPYFSFAQGLRRFGS